MSGENLASAQSHHHYSANLTEPGPAFLGRPTEQARHFLGKTQKKVWEGAGSLGRDSEVNQERLCKAEVLVGHSLATIT